MLQPFGPQATTVIEYLYIVLSTCCSRSVSIMANQPKKLHLVGTGVTHSIAPNMHNHIAKSLNLPWTFHATECPTLVEVIRLARDETTAGLVVTMPYKTAIIPHLDEVDDLAKTIGACNNVYYKGDRICGTNTDWLGIKGCLLEKSGEATSATSKCALIVGAGGASRAAVYALTSHLHCRRIYVLNRDEAEVEDLKSDMLRLPITPEIIHVKDIDQARQCDVVEFVVGTVPDLEPQTTSELRVAEMLKTFLKQESKGVLLDMCFKPRRTRMIKLAESLGWPYVEGTHIIGYQIEKQYSLWVGETSSTQLDREGAWRTLLYDAEQSLGINF